MGNCISISLQSNADSAVSHCCDFIAGQASYVYNLEENMEALKIALEELTDAKNVIVRRVKVAEEEQLKRLETVQRWISRVEIMVTEANELMLRSSEEINGLCLWGCCSKNYRSSYKFGKRVSEKLAQVIDLQSRGVFEVVAEREPIASVVEIPIDPTVGLESLFDKVWTDLNDEKVGIMGLYGIGGVGKTTLLKKINNNFLSILNNYYVIWVVVSKDHTLEKIQNDIGEKIGYSDDKWKNKNYQQKATDIFSTLSVKKFVLLLDDIWERVDLTELGVPLPCIKNGCKLVFTTRSKKVCFDMEANKKVEVKCLSWDNSWKLFQEKVGEEALYVHPDIRDLAVIVAKECGGLPLALITIGRAMACKQTPQEWEHAIQVLKNSASDFSGMGDKVLPLLKFSYDNLSSENIKSCFLYCALFPEDTLIRRTDLIEYWICEGFLDKYANIDSAAHIQGYDIIGSLLYACLLEESGVNHVKMHDIIRDMALWIACGCGKAEYSSLVQTNARLLELPRVEKWNQAKRISLMTNHIESLSVTPTCPNLLTLFLSYNNLHQITDGFFEFMPKLRVLDLSGNRFLTYLPTGISKLVSLEYLNLSSTKIEEIPIELKNLVMLRYLNLRFSRKLDIIPQKVISSFSRLQILDTYGCGKSRQILEDNVQCGGNELLVHELQHLKHLIALRVSITCVNALERLLTSQMLQNCTQSLWLRHLSTLRILNLSSFLNMKHLDRLTIKRCTILEELKFDWDWERMDQSEITSSPLYSMITSKKWLLNLHEVRILLCQKLKDLTGLIFAPNLQMLLINGCIMLEEIVCLSKLGDAQDVAEHVEPFGKLETLHLIKLPLLKNIYPKPLPFRCLRLIEVSECVELKKLSVNPNISMEPKLTIKGEESWWNELEWDNETTRDAFLPCFQAFSRQS